jgi:hypothetical protein
MGHDRLKPLSPANDQLDGALSRLMAAGGKDSHALSLIEKEMDRRDKAKAGGSPKGETPGAGDTGLDDSDVQGGPAVAPVHRRRG